MIAACKDGSIRMVSNATGELERSIENIEAGQAYIVDTRSTEQSLIAAAFEDKSIRVFDYLTGEELTKITAAHTGIRKKALFVILYRKNYWFSIFKGFQGSYI